MAEPPDTAPSSELLDVLQELRGAIDDELRDGGLDGKPVSARAVVTERLGRHATHTIWRVRPLDEIKAPDEAPIVVENADRQRFDGLLVTAADDVAVIGVEEDVDLGGEVVIMADLSFILRAADRLIQQAVGEARDNRIVAEILGVEREEPHDGQSSRGRRGGVDERAATTPRALEFVWGPPGTGKTEHVGNRVTGLMRSGEPVVVLAPSNAAVDVVACRVHDVAEQAGGLLPGQVLRVGQTASPEVAARPKISPLEVVRSQHPEIVTAYEKAGRHLRALRSRGPAGDSAALRKAREAFCEARDRLRSALAAVVKQAEVVCATLARAMTDPEVRRRIGGAVLVIDEGSMALIPEVVATALQGPAAVVIVGDFRQLPPVVESKSERAQRWLGRDVFTTAGVSGAVASEQHDPRLHLLDVQHRMSPRIGDIVSRFAYYGLLRTADGVEERTRPWADLLPCPGESIIAVDTTDLVTLAATSRTTEKSRFTPAHLLLDVALAAAVHGHDGTTAVVTPYRAQAAALRDACAAWKNVRASTVHKLQGSEADVVIIDLVDSFPSRGPTPLTGDDDLAVRLLNVAVSRGRGKVVVLYSRQMYADRPVDEAPVLRLVDLVPAAINGQELLAQLGAVRWGSMTAVLAGITPRADLQLVVPWWFDDSSSLAPLAGLLDAAERPTVFVPGELVEWAEGWESADIRRLRPFDGLLVLSGTDVVIGGADDDAPVLHLTHAGLAASLSTHLLGGAQQE